MAPLPPAGQSGAGSQRIPRVHYALGAVLLAILAVSVWLLQALWARSESASRVERIGVDSALHLAFQLEKEFLRLRHHIALAQHQPEAAQQLPQRIDIFLSRIDLLSDNPSTALLQEDETYRALMPRLQTATAELEALAPQLACPLNKAPWRLICSW